VDFLATVAAYPKPDEKIRTTSFKVFLVFFSSHLVMIINSYSYNVTPLSSLDMCVICLGSRRWQYRQCLNMCLSIRTQTKNNFQGFFFFLIFKKHTTPVGFFFFFFFFIFVLCCFISVRLLMILKAGKYYVS